LFALDGGLHSNLGLSTGLLRLLLLLARLLLGCGLTVIVRFILVLLKHDHVVDLQVNQDLVDFTNIALLSLLLSMGNSSQYLLVTMSLLGEVN